MSQIGALNSDAFFERLKSVIRNEIDKSINTDFDVIESQKKRIERVKQKYASREVTCELLGISKSTLHKLIKNGELSFIKNGRYTLIPIQSIEDYLTRNTKTIEN